VTINYRRKRQTLSILFAFLTIVSPTQADPIRDVRSLSVFKGTIWTNSPVGPLSLERSRDELGFHGILFGAMFVERTVCVAGSTIKVSRWSKQIKVTSSDTCVSVRDCPTSVMDLDVYVKPR
jgi:hypothetical protein